MSPAKHVFITGATSGIGKVAALELAAKGFRVIATCRNTTKGEQLLDALKTQYPDAKGSIEFISCDLSSLASVDNACGSYLNQYSQLDIIINNAGVWKTKFEETTNQIEATFAVNFLAPVLIVRKLSPLLAKASDPRIINTASSLHQGAIDFDDIEFRNKKFSGYLAYRQSKLALILFTRLMSKKLSSTPIEVYANHPGLVATEIGRDSGSFTKLIFRIFGKTPQKGAQTLLHLCAAGKSNLTNGEYYVNKKLTQTTNEAYNLDTAERLHILAEEYLKDYWSIEKTTTKM